MAFVTDYPDGQYLVSYSGTANLTFGGVGKLTTPATLGSDGLYHAVLTIDHASYYNPKILVMQVNGLSASNPFGNLKIITPGYAANTTQVFTNSSVAGPPAFRVHPDDGVEQHEQFHSGRLVGSRAAE